MKLLCAVCGSEIGTVQVGGLTVHIEFAVVGREERLCMGVEGCFGWFSGYPWVLFEMGMLVSRLWEPWDDPHALLGRRW